ncbi:hypothetical protein G6F64_014692 [Rhizopus arrhizus]|uniref:Uncharacterized protein n=1 Tax=Rhizopus oryzae TaxID=64495 RepID=A0A9P6WSY4_RHIOR|nr:hypothetical protein G6F64_014692 [Rhizopus arrhizus]
MQLGEQLGCRGLRVLQGGMDARAKVPHAGSGMQRRARLRIDVAAVRRQAVDDRVHHMTVFVMILGRGQQCLRGALVFGRIGTAACRSGQWMRQQLRATLAQQQLGRCADQPGGRLPQFDRKRNRVGGHRRIGAQARQQHLR